MLAWLTGAVLGVGAVAATVYYVAPGAMLAAVTAAARRAAGLRLRTVSVDGHEVPYLAGGRGPVLLLLHGFAANKDNWTLIARHLTGHFRLVVPDLPGFGDSSRRPEASYDARAQVRRLATFADALGLERFHLGGNSMGGYLAALFAARYPERVESLWLLAPAGALSAEPSELQHLIERGENPLVVRDAAGFDRLTKLCFSAVPPMPARFKRPLVERAAREAPFNERIFEQLFNAPVALEGEVEGLDTRALVVWGDEDRVLHPSGAQVVARLLPRSECRIMRHMGHVPMIERPAETAADLLRFHGKAG